MKTTFTLVLLVAYFSCSAQVKLEVGAGGSPASTLYHANTPGGTFNSLYTPIITFSPSVFFKVDIHNKVGVTTGFQYLSKTRGIRDMVFFNANGGNSVNSTIRIRHSFFSIPLNITYNFLPKDKKFSAGVMVLSDFSELYVRVSNAPGMVVDGVPIHNLKSYASSDSTGTWNKPNIDVGLGVFAGYSFNKHFNILVYPFYKRDITNLVSGNTANYFTALGIGVAAFYQFGTEPKQEK